MIVKEYPTKIIEKNSIAKDTYEVKFSRPKDFEYLAGQYIIVKINTKMPKGMAPVRALSLSTSPNNKEFLSVCFRYNSDPTHFKKLLIENETDVIIRGPLGKFTLPNETKKDITMIAGGVGIVPFVGMLKYLKETKSKQKVKLIYTDKSKEKMAYLQELKDLKKGNKNWRLITRTKRADKQFLKEKIDINSLIYVCGRAEMVKDVMKILLELGVKEENLILEKY